MYLLITAIIVCLTLLVYQRIQVKHEQEKMKQRQQLIISGVITLAILATTIKLKKDKTQ